jgi:hypothetical protein
MKLFIAEEEKNNILNMYGIINEQTEDFSVPQGAIDAVRSIESKFSYMKDGVINGRTFKGDEKVNMLRNYMSETIGLDCWNNMSSKLKAQIYAFCFQADGDVPYKLKIIAGLANAIDSNVVRKDIVGKPLSDPAVQRAIQIIKNNCENINSYYDKYLSILDTQYKSMDYNDNYKNIWKFRPIAIDRIMSGQDVDKTLGEWSKFISGKLEPEQPKTEMPKSAEPAKTEMPKSAESPKPVVSKPVESPKPTTPKPAESPKPVVSKPVESPKPDTPKPAESPKPVVSKPAESPKSVAPNTPETKGPQRARIMTINPKDW